MSFRSLKLSVIHKYRHFCFFHFVLLIFHFIILFECNWHITYFRVRNFDFIILTVAKIPNDGHYVAASTNRSSPTIARTEILFNAINSKTPTSKIHLKLFLPSKWQKHWDFSPLLPYLADIFRCLTKIPYKIICKNFKLWHPVSRELDLCSSWKFSMLFFPSNPTTLHHKKLTFRGTGIGALLHDPLYIKFLL